MPFHVGPLEMIILFTIVVMVFGIGKLPEVGSSLGRTIKEFRKGAEGPDEAPKA